MHALAHLPGRWIVTGATNTKLALWRLDDFAPPPAAVSIPGMGYTIRPDGSARVALHDGGLIPDP